MARKKATRTAAKTPKRPARRRKPAAAPAKDAPKLPDGEFLDTEQAIKFLKTTRPTFYRWLRTGRIKGVKAGRQWRFRREDIERFVNGREPEVRLGADIKPLLATLAERLKKVGGSLPSASEDQPDLRAVAMTINLALTMEASDIHFEPYEKTAVLRLRVDGVLHKIADFDLRLMPALAERVKRMAACDVTERRLPQDGRIMVSIEGAQLDLRVNVLPALMGEAVTMRVLRRDEALISLDRIHYAPADRERLIEALANPWGLVIVAGPTGCGKTTVLYACLRHLIRPAVKVMSVEDPVEYMIPGMVQVPLRHAEGMTFARTVRAFLRADPDVMMVGEIRGREDMELCQQAALTGHLVMTTLHTDSAPATLKRMTDIGSPPFLVADSVKFISAQRLVRCLCPECSEPVTPSANALSGAQDLVRTGGVNWDGLEMGFRKPVGCAKCGRTGYRGRTLVVEMMQVTPEIGAALRGGAGTDDLRRIAVEQGMTTMGADGVRRAAAGETTLEEVFRVLSVRW